MKIVMATHYFGSHKGGIEIVAERLYRELAVQGQEVIWLAGDVTPPPEIVGTSRPIGMRVLNWMEKKVGIPFPIPTLRALKAIRSTISGADVVILHDSLYLSNIAAFFSARSSGVPIILVQHIGFVPYESRLLSLLMKFANATVTRSMLSNADQVVFISETIRKYFSKLKFRRPPETVFNGVESNIYRTLEGGETKAALREQYGLPKDRPAILFVGRFVEKKGMPILREMASVKPEYTWAFAGWGPLNPEAWNLPNVKVFAGLQGEKLAALYRACDLLILPSKGEGFPLVIQEALASGLPVVCAKETLAADPEMDPFVQGVPLYPGQDLRTAEAFIATVNSVLSDGNQTTTPEDRRDFAVIRYSWRQAAERYVEIARHLLTKADATAVAVRPNSGMCV